MNGGLLLLLLKTGWGIINECRICEQLLLLLLLLEKQLLLECWGNG